MKDNDLDNAPTPKYLVLAEAVLVRKERTESFVEGKWRKRTLQRSVVDWLPDLRALSELWRFSSGNGARLVLVFAGELVPDAPEIWQLIDDLSANPFNDYLVYEKITHIVRDLPYRPDVVGVIDVPDRSAYYGGRGLTLASLR